MVESPAIDPTELPDVITSYLKAHQARDVDTAMEAVRCGAYHYVSKDFDLSSIRTLFANASERQDLNRDVTRLKEEVAEQNEREFVVGSSRSTRSPRPRSCR